LTRRGAHTSSHAVVEPTDLPSDASASRSRISASVAPRPAARRRTSQRVYRHGESICFGNSILIRRMSARTPASMRGRPPKFRDFQRQYRRKPVGAFRNSPQSSHVIVPARRHDVRQGIFPVKINPARRRFINPARRRFGTAQAKPTGSFHSGGLIGRDARTTSAQGRACSAAPVDSGGASRWL
jgi:hypothetical protein